MTQGWNTRVQEQVRKVQKAHPLWSIAQIEIDALNRAGRAVTEELKKERAEKAGKAR